MEVGASRAARATAETDGVTSADDRPFADDGAAHVAVDRLQTIGVADDDVVAVAPTFVGLDTYLP